MFNTYVYNFAIVNFLWVCNIENSNMLAVKITGVGICVFSIQDSSHSVVCCGNSIMLNKFLPQKMKKLLEISYLTSLKIKLN